VVLILMLIRVLHSENCTSMLQWSTKNGQILVNGQPLVLKGIIYPGFQTKAFTPHGLLKWNLDEILDVIKVNDFNAIQIFFSMELISDNPTVTSKNVDCKKNTGFCGATCTR
ncbi:hypothetical protein PMAYCL1PPCAC_22266, partial [Pristionchus mayeri]